MPNFKHSKHAKTWQFWIDVGGTFTDVVALDPENQWHTHKLLSNQPQCYDNAALQGIREITKLAPNADLSQQPIGLIRLGTTIATNSLLERKGANTALLVTRGFKDALLIGDQHRPDIFALQIKQTPPLYQQVIEIDERVTVHGDILQPLHHDHIIKQLSKLKNQGIDAIAIVFMHAYQYPKHEQEVSKLAKKIGFKTVWASHQVSPLIKFIPRGNTTVVNAYLTPALQTYLATLQRALPNTRHYFMQSSGGLAMAQQLLAKDTLLSGPAGGVIGASKVAQALGYKKMIGFDMGGTSTDVCHFSGELEHKKTIDIAGLSLAIPMLAIHTIAAGGGSICDVKQGRLTVGPESAGADPGPACYGKGGPLTITDCHLLLGHLQADAFSNIFGKHGNQALNLSITQQRFAELAARMKEQTGESFSVKQLAGECLELATENMAEAIKKVSIAQGHDTRDHVLVSFGGAGGQHACAIAEKLAINTIVCHPQASVLSAVGIGLSSLTHILQQHCAQPLDQQHFHTIQEQAQQGQEQATFALQEQGANLKKISTTTWCELAYQHSDILIPILLADRETMKKNFEKNYQMKFGYTLRDQAIQVRHLFIEARENNEENIRQIQTLTNAPKQKIQQGKLYHLGQSYSANIIPRQALTTIRTALNGPLIIPDQQSCYLVPPGWSVKLAEHNECIFQRTKLTTGKKQHPDNRLLRALFSACQKTPSCLTQRAF